MTDHPQLVQTVLDATDVRELAEFYRQLLGLHYEPGDEPSADGDDDVDWLTLRSPRGESLLAFQETESLTPTTWPSPEVPQQLHLDFAVTSTDELVRQRDRVLALGGALRFDRFDDPDEPLYVFADPAGHTFCIFVG